MQCKENKREWHPMPSPISQEDRSCLLIGLGHMIRFKSWPKSVKVCIAFLLCKEYDLAYSILNTLHYSMKYKYKELLADTGMTFR
ncbi:hypothetical protein Fmac_007748 [Flemingia macrophylla]|uniref:Uncharacterized protein n=1 Tax=Flemingia macrophylla TaxID=520843 RepID=A0ABD1MVG1_9FABA